jgi:hypothetical protein
MAFDGKGKYHMNPHHAKMADGFEAKRGKEGSPEEEASEPESERESEGDTEDGDGPHEMLQELHAKHGGKHMHVHAHDQGVTTHHIGDDGNVEGPHHHASTQEAADHMHMVMGDGMDQAEPEQAPVHSGHPMMAGY